MNNITAETRADKVARACWVAECALTELLAIVDGATSSTEARADKVARACWVAEVALTELLAIVDGATSSSEALELYDAAKAIETLATRVVFASLTRADHPSQIGDRYEPQ